MTKKTTLISTLIAILTLFLASLAGAQPQLSSTELLLPSFEVELNGGRTTFFSVVNSSDFQTEIKMGVYSNWGIEIFSTRAHLAAHEAKAFNLSDWLIEGKLPDRILSAENLAHAQAALSGQASPRGSLYYGTETEIELAFGFVRIRQTAGRGAVFGDFFVFDPQGDNAQGDLLLDTSPGACAGPACEQHGVRFFLGGALGTDTELMVWSARPSQPSESPYFLEQRKIAATLYVYRQNGELVEVREMSFLPLQAVKLSELGFDARAGWIRVVTEQETFIAVRYDADDRFSVGLRAVCLPPDSTTPTPDPSPTPRIRIEKHTNGEDADNPTGPMIPVGDPVLWEYFVTNTGNETLTDIVVSDDQGVNVDCPQDELAAGESMTCTGNGIAEEGQYRNVGTATGWGTESGKKAVDSDPSHYYGEIPPPPPIPSLAIEIEKATNGEDADEAPGPSIPAGDPVTWTYVVTNNSSVELTNVEVSDDQGVVVSCPKTTLAVDEKMTCTGHGTATEGQYGNVGSVIGKGDLGGGNIGTVTDSDPSHYFGMTPPPPPAVSIDIEKATNGHDADTAPGPSIKTGDPVTWTYVVTNDGEADLSNVQVSDNRGVAVSCPKTSLKAGQSMTCTGHGTATEGQYSNIGTATGDGDGKTVTDSDPSHYFGMTPPPPPTVLIDIEKATNGHDADVAPGPTILEGSAVTWTYVVTNIGEADLVNVQVSDNRGVAVSCPKTSLKAGESMTCTGYGTATAGQYSNLGTATGEGSGMTVSDSDPSHYYGEEIPPPPGGTQGCTPGYWKNHTDSWAAAGYSPGQATQSVFGQASAYPAYGSASLHEALSFKGGSGVEGGVGNLLRAAVAGLLNTSHDGVSYPRATALLISDVNSALGSGDRDTMLSLASSIDRDNNLGCPLS